MRSLLVLSAVGALHILGASAQDAKADCIQRGIANAITQVTTWGCASAEDKTCLCGSALTQFKESVGRFAYTDCQAQADEITGFFNDSYCKGVVVPSSSKAVPSSTTVESTSAASSTSVAETTSAVSSSATTQSSSSGVSTTATSTASSSSVTSKASTTLATSTSSPSATAAATSTSAGKDSSKKDDDTEAAGAAGGLSKGAAVGIGVGVGVAVIAIVVVVIALLLRRKRQNQAPAKRPMDISRPIQKDSRPYGSQDQGSYVEKRGGESFEMQANRYEDMLPRQTPRTMV
ncbi:unnamed protein product [Clonostachys chloroleuca]|uniref:Extracellular membrane protein CFEM domain-containing protein n=1 Tax=Clonostachys chloroleuca TaxID=1926264 RepID=A0AA35LYJ7_9HYPO|nr:unnamed protein product [Clonostachys chloroleuca]